MKLKPSWWCSVLPAILLAACLAPSAARAQAMLTFTGGNGTPLTLMLTAPVEYTVTRAGGDGMAPFIDFQGVGNVFGSTAGNVSGTLTFTIDGGTAQTLDSLRSGVAAGSIAANDAFIYGSEPGVVIGDIVLLNTGTLTTITNFAGAPPASGSYQTFLVDGLSNRLDAVNGVAVAPEPSTRALLGVGGIVLVCGVSRRRSCVQTTV